MNNSSDSEAASTPHGGGKKKEKMKPGILELATKEFESEVGHHWFWSISKAAVKRLVQDFTFNLFSFILMNVHFAVPH